MPPWNIVVGLLGLASPQPRRDFYRSLVNSLPAWPERTAVPRITVGGSLIVSPAQWRVDRRELWTATDRTLTKLSTMDGIRRRYGLPRLVQVRCEVHDEARAADLSSVHAVRTIEQCVRDGAATVTLHELLADPHQLPVLDQGAAGAGPSLAEIVLRLDPPTSGGSPRSYGDPP